MTRHDIVHILTDLRPGDDAAAAAVATRQAQLTKPPGSLGTLETLVAWLARWQGRAMPRLDRVEILVFAGNHGVTRQGVSPYPAAVTTQMVANFAAGGAAINQLAGTAGAALRVMPLDLDTPTADFSDTPAMDDAEFAAAFEAGCAAVGDGVDLLCLGEMGIGNTTAAAAIAAALFGGGGARWAGRGTGLDDAGLARKREVIDRALAQHILRDPLDIAMIFGGRELAALLGAAATARRKGIPVLLDGFVVTAAVAPWFAMAPGALDAQLGRACLGRGSASRPAGDARPDAAARSRPAAGRGVGRGTRGAGPAQRALPATPAWRTFAEAGVATA